MVVLNLDLFVGFVGAGVINPLFNRDLQATILQLESFQFAVKVLSLKTNE
ncbi:MAG: hypothetical protein SAK29_33800 [Scytonema sp. PMC 1069.18]|nr:hypothetical protein [Scytonema sp. PMC 1069.18]MEC4884345.1 hypothetical protein [Scytonema sp. PMC 1070.18]